MEKIGIVTEEAADLSQEIIKKYKIAVAEVALDWPETDDLPGDNIFQKMRELEKRGIESFGKTSQPSPKSFLECYKKQLERFEKVLCITITSKLSGTYNSAIQAKNFLSSEDQQRISVFDTLNGSAGEALFILQALDLIEEGKNTTEIMKELEKLVSEVRLFLLFKDPKWMEASGRISSLVANLLRKLAGAGIRPLLKFKNGILVPAGVKMKAKDIPTALFRQFESEVRKNSKGRDIRVVITHGDEWEGAERLKEMIEGDFPRAKVAFINIVNNIVGSLLGPDTIVCAWHYL